MSTDDGTGRAEPAAPAGATRGETPPGRPARMADGHSTWTMRLLGLCPLLAASDTLVRGLALGTVAVAVLIASAAIVRTARQFLPSEDVPRGTLHPPALAGLALLVSASLVSLFDTAMQRYLFQLHQSLGIFVPLIVTSALIVWYTTAGERDAPAPARPLRDAASLLAAFAGLGAARELLASGGLLAGAPLLGGAMVGNAAEPLVRLTEHGFAFVATVPGAFLSMAVLVASVRALQRARRTRPAAVARDPDSSA